jgi:hypothetical protein
VLLLLQLQVQHPHIQWVMLWVPKLINMICVLQWQQSASEAGCWCPSEVCCRCTSWAGRCMRLGPSLVLLLLLLHLLLWQQQSASEAGCWCPSEVCCRCTS